MDFKVEINYFTLPTFLLRSYSSKIHSSHRVQFHLLQEKHFICLVNNEAHPFQILFSYSKMPHFIHWLRQKCQKCRLNIRWILQPLYKRLWQKAEGQIALKALWIFACLQVRNIRKINPIQTRWKGMEAL